MKIAGGGLLAASGVFGLGILLQYLGYQSEPPPQTEFDLGPASRYPLGSRTNLADVPAILIHSESGFSALSLVCTHLGCTLEQKPDGFTCPCHGSHFSANGTVLRGPAAKSMVSLQIEQDKQGHLILHKNDQGSM